MSDAALLSRIAELAEQLCDPHPHVERVHYWDEQRNKKWRIHKTIQPGLLQQLYESVIPADRPTDRHTRPASRPPLALEALSAHMAITVAATRWCWSLHLGLRATPQSNIRALVGAAPTLDDDTAHLLHTELRAWRRTCAVLTGWEQLWRPDVPCPVGDCEQPTLRVNLTEQTALCATCRSTWAADDGSLYVLADHIRHTTDTAA